MAKFEQWGSGSRRSPQRRAERAARRSQKRAERLDAFGREAAAEAGFPGANDEPRSSVYDALAIVQIGVWRLGVDLEALGARIEEGPCGTR